MISSRLAGTLLARLRPLCSNASRPTWTNLHRHRLVSSAPFSTSSLLTSRETNASTTSASPTTESFEKLPFWEEVVSQLRASDAAKYRHLAPIGQRSSVISFMEEVLLRDLEDESKEMIELMHTVANAGDLKEDNRQIVDSCLASFEKWLGASKFGIAYLMYINDNINSGSFVTEVVEHLARDLTRLDVEDLVTLMMMLYFKKRWTVDSATKVVDLVVLQKILAARIKDEQLSNAEICAVCIGFKRIEDFAATQPTFRDSLYKYLYRLGRSSVDVSPTDEMSIVQVCTLLTRGNMVYRDDVQTMGNALESLASKSDGFKLATAVKAACLGALINLRPPELFGKVMARFGNGEKLDSIRDMTGWLSFLSRTECDAATLHNLLEEVVGLPDEGRNVRDLGDFVQCLAFLSCLAKFDYAVLRRMFRTVNSMDEKTFFQDDHRQLELQILKKLFLEFFPDSWSTAGESVMRNRLKAAAAAADSGRCLRALITLDVNAEIDAEDFDDHDRLRLDYRRHLVKLFRIGVPAEAHVPQMPLDRLPQRQRNLVTVKRELDNILGGEGYCALTHILPQMMAPDLMFGSLAGVRMRVPSEFVDAHQANVRRAPDIGDWIVISVNMSTSGNYSRSATGSNELMKRRQLNKLGYQILDFDIKDLHQLAPESGPYYTPMNGKETILERLVTMTLAGTHVAATDEENRRQL